MACTTLFGDTGTRFAVHSAVTIESFLASSMID